MVKQVESIKYPDSKRYYKIMFPWPCQSIVAYCTGFENYSIENICCSFTIGSSNPSYFMLLYLMHARIRTW